MKRVEPRNFAAKTNITLGFSQGNLCENRREVSRLYINLIGTKKPQISLRLSNTGELRIKSEELRIKKEKRSNSPLNS